MKGLKYMNKKIIKPIIVFSIIIFVIIVFIIFYLSNKDSKSKKNNILNETEIITDDEIEDSDFNILNNQKEDNNIELNNSTGKKIELDPPDTDPWNEKGPIQEERLILEKKTDAFSYFEVKHCLTLFYSSKDNTINVLESKLKKYDISNLYNNKQDFCIDEIYKAHVTGSKDFYYIYYRVGVSTNTIENKQILIKGDLKNDSFYVYPYEYLKSIGYIDLKDGSKISLDIVDVTDIEKTEYNNLNQFKIKKNEPTCIKELFERFEFDVKYDLNHLYNSLDEEYKNIRFENNFQKFTSFMNNRREIYVEDIIKGYQKYELNWYTQYIIICRNDDHFVVNMVDLMNYSIQFDNYTTVIPAYSELYNSNLPHIKPKYCMDRIRKAINDENYEFIYSKLNPVQKSNYFSRFDVFVSYIQNNFYKRNVFDYKKYTKVSDSVYTYNVNVKNEMNENDYRIFKMTVTLKEAEDFSISITN